MRTPIALFIFKRPEATQRVFDVIRQARPSKLFVLADAPRQDRPDEFEKCAAAKAIVEQVDWDCQVIRRYSETNLGMGKQISSGLSWVFNQVEEAIILEDDCVVHPSFFRFCEEMLEHYRDDSRVFSIAAQNVQLGYNRTEYSYYFSRYHHIWGWATWRRAWQHYDYQMQAWPQVRPTNWLKDLLGNGQAAQYWDELFQATYEGKIQTWDYQWTLSCWLQQGLSIIPNVNLVSNVGFDADATSFKGADNPTMTAPVAAMDFPLKHPPLVMRHVQADAFTQKLAYEGGSLRQIKRQIKRILKYRLGETRLNSVSSKFSSALSKK